MTDNFDLNLLPVALALYEEKSVGEAARRLRMSQPATSRALGKLRHIFLDELFVRSGYQMVPTPKGRALALSARELLAHAKPETLVNTDFEPSTTQTTFCVAVNETAELWIIPELLRELKIQAPNARVRSVCPPREQLVARLETGDVDLAFGPFSQLNRSEFVRQKLADVIVVCLMRSDHPFKGEVLTSQQYSSLTHVEVSVEDNAGIFFDRLLRSRHFNRNIAVSVAHASCLPGVLKSCDAIATIASSAAAYFCKTDKQLKIVKAPARIVLPGHLYWHSRYQKDPRSQFLRQAFKRALIGSDIMALSKKPD